MVGETLDPGAESVEPCGPTDANCFPSVLEVSDEGTTLHTSTNQIDFVGSGVSVASSTGGLITVTVPGDNVDWISYLSASSTSFSTQVGFGAGTNLNGAGTSNTAVGYMALSVSTSSVSNTAVGDSALMSNTYGNQNTAVGVNALYDNTTGGSNNAFGAGALAANTTGANNSAFGLALWTNTTGDSNSAFGNDALFFNTTGDSNSAFGNDALLNNTTGSYNTAVGVNALYDLDITANDGSGSNTALGYNTGLGIVTGVNNTILGANVTGLASGLSNNIIIADGSGNRRINVDASGNVGIGTTTPNARLAIDNTAVPIGPELITNGTFTGTEVPWTLGTDVVYGTDNVVSTYAGGDPQVSQTFETVAGNTYLVTFTISGANAPMSVSFDNAQNSYQSFFNGTHSLAFTTSFTGTDTIWFDDNNYVVGDTWALDDVSIKEIPPVSPTLLVTGYEGSTWLSLGEDILGNTALGQKALSSNTTGMKNTTNGAYTLYSNTTGNENTASGFQSLLVNTTGNYNTANGAYTLYSNTTGYQNTASGQGTLYSNTTGYNNTASGVSALYSNTTGYENAASGYQSLFSNTTGSQNTANGYLSLYSNINGIENTANGHLSLYSNTTGSKNVGSGVYSLYANITGSENTANGYASLSSNTDGNYNTASGVYSLTSNTVGSRNTTSGYQSFFNNTTGNENTANGAHALSQNTTGSKNLALGYRAGFNLTSGDNNIIIGGNSIDFPLATGSNQLNIGNLIYGTGLDGTGTTLSTGNIGIGTTTPTAQFSTTGTVRFSNFGAGTLQTDANGNLSVSSDERLKNIEVSFTRGVDALRGIEPISYHWNEASGFDTTELYTGFSAQNIQEFIPEAVGMDKHGFLTLSDRPLLATVINATKEQQIILDELLLASSSVTSRISGDTFWPRLTALVGNFVDGVLTVVGIHSDEVQTKELCIGESGDRTCITKERLDNLLRSEVNNSTENSPDTSNEEGTGTQESSDEVDIVIDTEDEVVVDPLVPEDVTGSEEVVDDSATDAPSTVEESPTPSAEESSETEVPEPDNSAPSESPVE